MKHRGHRWQLGSYASAVGGDPVPPDENLILMRYTADEEPEANAALCDWMHDQSGNARDLGWWPIASGGVARYHSPTMRTDQIAGHKTWHFTETVPGTGAPCSLKSYGWHVDTVAPITFAAVIKFNNADTTVRRHFVFDSWNSSGRMAFGMNANGSMRMYSGQDLDQPGVTFPFPEFEIWVGVFDGVSSLMRRNGVTIKTGNVGTDKLEDGLVVGGLNSGADYSSYDNGNFHLADLIFYQAHLTTPKIEELEEYLDQTYDLGIF